MTDRPILYNGQMVRALYDGNKTQTRRALDLSKYGYLSGYSATGRLVNYYGDDRLGLEFIDNRKGRWHPDTNPSGCSGWCVPISFSVGDRLWVRESFFLDAQLDAVPSAEMSHYEPVTFAADGLTRQTACAMITKGKCRPCIFMPRWASRLTLTVTDVRVQRLHDISENDAWAEGVGSISGMGRLDINGIVLFQDLWNSTDPKLAHTWAENPWVAAVTFTVHRENIDAMQVAA